MDAMVRPARSGDGARLAEICLDSARAAWADHLPADGLAAMQSPAEEWEPRISDPDLVVLVAEVDGEPEALAVLCPSTDQDAGPAEVALLDLLYTHPGSWGSGLGRALLAASSATFTELRYRTRL